LEVGSAFVYVCSCTHALFFAGIRQVIKYKMYPLLLSCSWVDIHEGKNNGGEGGGFWSSLWRDISWLGVHVWEKFRNLIVSSLRAPLEEKQFERNEKLDKFIKAAILMHETRCFDERTSYLSLLDETELWRGFIHKFPDVFAYLSHEKEEEIIHLYEFFIKFYSSYWMSRCTIIDSIKKISIIAWVLRALKCLCYPFKIFSFGLRLLRRTTESDEETEKEDTINQRTPERTMTRRPAMNKAVMEWIRWLSVGGLDDDERDEHTLDGKLDGEKDFGDLDGDSEITSQTESTQSMRVTWLVLKRNRAQVARWLAKGSKYPEARTRFKNLALDIDRTNPCDGCWEEKLMRVCSAETVSFICSLT